MDKLKVILKNVNVLFSKVKVKICSKIKCLWDVLVRNVPAENISNYEDFTPEKELKNGEEYIKALHWALKNEDVRNIALAGPYGSGKSSIIRSYLEKHPSTQAINISLATFDWNKEEHKGFKNEIELGILKQLFYKVASKKIPQSRYRKLHKIDLRNYLFACILFFGIVLSMFGFFFPKQMLTGLEWIVKSGQVYNLSEKVSFFLVGVFFAIVMIFVSIVCKGITTRFKLKEINIANKATVSSEKDETSVFDKNMDEIIYFFEETTYDTVFLEDLDRFDSTEIFVKLRELNTILNNYDLIKRRIVFVYAIKDEMFKNEERTKFFDFIIPVIPIINSTNSGEILRSKLKFGVDENGIYQSTIYDISSSYITVISPFIEDMRVLTSICNEFVIYKNTLKGIILKDETMFSLMIFKNLYPTEFVELEQEKGIVTEAFSGKRTFIDNKIKALKKENEEKKAILADVDKDILRSTKELKAAFMNFLAASRGPFKTCVVNNKRYDYSAIMESDFNLNDFDCNKRATISYFTGYYSNTEDRVIDNLGSEIKNNSDFFERWNDLHYVEEHRKETLRKEIQDNEEKINDLRGYSMMSLLNEYGADEILPENVRENKVLVFMLKRGFINESYADYINYFHPNSITEMEMNFIRGIRMEEAIGDFSYPIKNVGRVCERIEDYEFKQVEVLNFDVLDYLLTKRLEDSSCKNFFVGLKRGTDKEIGFINGYIERNENTEIFIKTLCSHYPAFWVDVKNRNTITDDSKFKYLKLILSHASESDIVQMNNVNEAEAIKGFIVQHIDSLGKLREVSVDRICAVIDKLDICFVNVDIANVDGRVLDYIFDMKKYTLNADMITRFCEHKFPEKLHDLEKSNYTTLCEIAYTPVLEYVYENFADYVTDVVLGQENNSLESLDAVEDILERLFIENPELCIRTLDKQEVIWDDLEDCCKAEGLEKKSAERKVIWNHVLKNRRVKVLWTNFVSYYDSYGLSDELLTWLDNEIDMFIQDNSISSELVEEIIASDISLESFTKMIQTYKVIELTNGLFDFTPEQIEIMVKHNNVPFSTSTLHEMQDKAKDVVVEYVTNNKAEFIEELEDCNLLVDVIASLIKNDGFNDSQRLAILQKIEGDDVDLSLAMAICDLKFAIPKEYVEASWNILDEENRYQLFLNHLQIYTVDEISEKLSSLAPEYQKLADRTKKHKENLYIDELGYNKALLEKLSRIGYLTSVEIEDYVVFNTKSQKKEKKQRFVVWVKKANE